MCLSLVQVKQNHVEFTPKEVKLLFDAAVAPTGAERVTLHDLRVLGEAQSLTFLEELGEKVVQGRTLKWLRGHVAWEREEEPKGALPAAQSEVKIVGEQPSAAPSNPEMIVSEVQMEGKTEMIKGETQIEGKDMSEKRADRKSSGDGMELVEKPGSTSASIEDEIKDEYEVAFQEFVSGAPCRHVLGEEVYTVGERDVVLHRDVKGRPLRAVYAEPREELELEIVGWEWSPEKLLRVVHSEDDDEEERQYGKGDVVWDSKIETHTTAFFMRAVTEAEGVDPEPAD
eukprot:3068473-Rhodomonas_salina.2